MHSTPHDDSGQFGVSDNEQADRHRGVMHPEIFPCLCISAIPRILIQSTFVESGCPSVPNGHELKSFDPSPFDDAYPESAS